MSTLSIMSGRATFEGLRTLDNSDISDAYAKVGSPLLNPARMVRIYNGTNTDMIFSIDGTNDAFIVAAGDIERFDFTTNTAENVQGFSLPQNTQFWVKEESAPDSGAVWITVVVGLSNPY